MTQEFPKYQFAWKVLGVVLKQTGRAREALPFMEQSIRLSPQDAVAHRNLGLSLQELGRQEEAEASFVQAIALKPDYAEAHFDRSITLKKLGRLDDAEASYRQTITLKADYAEAHNNLGNMFLEANRLVESESSLRQAIALKPDFAEAHNNLGITLQELERLDEAESSYRQAIALEPCYPSAHNNLGNMLRELGRLGEAEESLGQAIALEPDYAEAHSNLGITRHALGRSDEAEVSLAQAIALKPDLVKAHYNLGITLRELGRLDEAAASYRQAIALKPDYPSAKHMLAALTGETTAAAPQDYVEELFDDYATKFEGALVDDLGYKGPKLIADIIKKDSNLEPLGSIVDLGCGTGLFGEEIKQFCEYLEGVDLSEKMLDQAKKKSVYNHLIRQSIADYLSTASLNFDYFILADVLVYFGDLSDVFRLIKSRNRIGGKLAFSTEDYDGDGFQIEQSGRYSHSKAYIDSLCEKYDFKLRHFETKPLRKEKNQFIKGGFYLLGF